MNKSGPSNTGRSSGQSSVDMTWKQFETLVARMEQALTDIPVQVKVRDKVWDRVAEIEREVDATIRYRRGSSTGLTTIECRKRKSGPDVRWIEQLSVKREHIGAERTIAVSSTPFSKAAKRKASFLDIELRMLQEVTDVDIRNWATGVRVEAMSLAFTNIELTLTVAGDLRDDFLTDAVKRGISDDIFEANIFLLPNGAKVSLGQLLDARGLENQRLRQIPIPARVTLPPLAQTQMFVQPRAAILWDSEIPTDGSVVRRRLEIDFEGDVLVDTIAGPMPVLRASMAMDCQVLPPQELLPSVFSYSSPDSDIAYASQTRIEVDGSVVELFMTKDASQESRDELTGNPFGDEMDMNLT